MIINRTKIIRNSFLLLFIFSINISYAAEYSYHFKGIKTGIQKFMRLRQKLQGRLSQKDRKNINFSLGEYYFGVNSMSDAKQTFEQCLEQSDIDISKLLANVYLLKIARHSNRSERIEEIKKSILGKRFILLFEQYKTLSYVSAFGNEYEIKYFVDKIEILLNGDLFEEIVP